MKVKSLNDEEFVRVIRSARSTSDPEFQDFEERLLKERRLFVSGLTRQQKARLYHVYPRKIHIVTTATGTLVYLENT